MGHRTLNTKGMWSAKITAMVTENQIRFFKFQWTLMARIITPNTMQATRPASALYKKVIRKNTGATKAPIFRPVKSVGSFALGDS